MKEPLKYLRQGTVHESELNHLDDFGRDRSSLVLAPILIRGVGTRPETHHVAGHWCMLVLHPCGYFVFDPAGGGGEHITTVREAVGEWVNGIPDGGVSTMTLQGDTANCGVWLVAATCWILGLGSPCWAPWDGEPPPVGVGCVHAGYSERNARYITWVLGPPKCRI